MAYARMRARIEANIRKKLAEASAKCGRVSHLYPHLGNRVIFELKTERPGMTPCSRSIALVRGTRANTLCIT
eukprot:385731-Pyramimonas_sp.AAC.1